MTNLTGDKSRYETYADIFRYRDAVVPTSLAIAYVVVSYPLALLMLAGSGLAFGLGVLLLAHSLVISAYLIHECTHGSLFRPVKEGGTDYHIPLAVLLSWFCGASYGTFAAIRDKHLRHHFERADIVAVDYRRLLDARPRLAQLVLRAQQWSLPAVELLMHSWQIIRPFTVPSPSSVRARMVIVCVLRLLYFMALGYLGGWPLLLGYAVAYLVFLTVLTFMDAFQHRYLLFTALDAPRSESPTRDQSRFPTGYFSPDYEDSHTFTNLISRRWPVLNLLVLNFCYHNVHHRQPMEPWYRLPRLHAEFCQRLGSAVEVGFSRQLRDFFRYRVERIYAPSNDQLGTPNAGATGVSFLVPL